MNSKKTNYVIAVINVISIISFYLLYFTSDYLILNMMTGGDVTKSINNNYIMEFLLNNIKIVMPIFEISIAIPNIISAIQNRKNKKLSFWQLVFGIIALSSGLSMIFMFEDSAISGWINRIMFIGIPIILAIKNLILIKKNRPTKLQIISYILAIIVAIIEIFNFIGAGTSWTIISVIMQIIYTHNQENADTEGKGRKIFNIIVYYIIYALIVMIFTFMVVYSLLDVIINNMACKSQLSKLYNDITKLQEADKQDLYIPVEKNFKYGYINENGEEVIPCQYDVITYFNQIEIDNNNYYIALAKKDNKFYVISKNNQSIAIDKTLGKNLQSMEEYFKEIMLQPYNENGNYNTGYLWTYEFLFQALNKVRAEIEPQQVYIMDADNYVSLTEKESVYYYSNKNYSMMIEPLYKETDDEYDESEEGYYSSYYRNECKVTITKSNGEEESSIVRLPGLNKGNGTLDTFINGYIQFEDEKQERNGWYDNDGNKIMISDTYGIYNIKDNKAILTLPDIEYDDVNNKNEAHYLIIDVTGKVLLQSTAIDLYDNMYLIKNDNNKMVLMDRNLNIISDEYDKIITNQGIDIAAQYCSYY